MGEVTTAVKLAVEMNWEGFSKPRWIRCVVPGKRSENYQKASCF